MKSSIAWTAKDGPKTDRLEVAGGADISSFLEVPWTLQEGDTLTRHQPFGIKTLSSDNAFGMLIRTLDFTWASRIWGPLRRVPAKAALR
jgi:hypothetical protein